MKKISIVTFCNNMWHINYGQVLQAYSMQEICKKLNLLPQVVRYRQKNSRDIFKNKLHFNFMNKLYEDYCQKKYIPKYDRNRVIKFQKFMYNNVNLTYPCYSIKDVENVTKKSDILICGSDQIWNPQSINKFYSLNFGTPKQKKIAYAASGVVKTNTLLDKKYEELSESLNSFCAISLREKSSIDILSKYTQKGIDDVLDPTLLLTKNDWDKVISNPNIKIDEPYIFCYILNEINPYKIILKGLMKKYNINKVIYVKAPSTKEEYLEDYIEKVDASPTEFIFLLKNSTFVCTNSFHGLVFSINYEKQFSIFINKSKNIYMKKNRQEDFLDKFHIYNVKCNCLKDIKSIKKINYEEVNRYLDIERKKSWDFLNNALFN